MVCVYEYNGKTYDKDDFIKILLEMKPSEASIYMPGVQSVPDAPFIGKTGSYVTLAIKRLVRMAAEKNFDVLAWTPGELQAERYDLSKQVDKIYYVKDSKGTYTLSVSKNERTVLNQHNMTIAEIEETVGKEIAQKIQDKKGSKKGTSHGTLEGLDLKVGGKGMKIFYDKILPSEIKKFFGKKAWGKPEIKDISIRVGKDPIEDLPLFSDFIEEKGYTTTEFNKLLETKRSEIREEYQVEYDRLAERPGTKKATLHSLEITPKMKQKALTEGMPLFQKGKKKPLGQIENLFSEDPVIIKAFAGANSSTPIHETGHLLTKILHQSRPEDYNTLADWVGVDKERAGQGIDQWTTEELEKSAKAFEVYVMEGKAPNKELKSVFERLKEWMIEVYKTIKALDVELSPEVRKVFDKLVAPEKVKEKSLWSAIKEFGGIKFEEGVSGYPKGTGLLSKKETGLTLDEMTSKLKEEGWIREDENISDLIKAGGLKRREKTRREINLETIEGLGGKEALSIALKVAIQDAKKAYAEGNMEGFAEGKAKIRALIEKSKQSQELRGEAKKLKGKVLKEIKKTKVKKQAGKPKGKFGAERQEIFDVIRGNVGLTQKAAAEKLISNIEAYTEEYPPDSVVLENRILSMQSTRVFDVTEDTLKDWDILLNDIKTLKAQGVLETELKSANRAALMDFYRREVIETVGGIPEGIETVGEEALTDRTLKTRIRNAIFAGNAFNLVTGWKDLLDIISFKDKESKAFDSPISRFGDVLDAKNVEKEGNMVQMEDLRAMMFDVYGLKSDRQMTKMLEKDSLLEDIGTFTNLRSEVVDLKLSRAQARKRLMEILDPTLHDTLFSIEGMAWTEEMVVAIREFLNPADELFIEKQMEFYREYYKSVNDIYSKIYGVNLPKNEFYSPISREGVPKTDDAGLGEFIKEMPARASAASAGSLKTRTRNIFNLQARNDVEVLQSHVAEMEHFKAWSEKIRDLNSVFNNPEVRQAIRINYGKSVDSHIQNFIKAFAQGGAETAQNISLIDKIRTSYTRSVLAIKQTLFLKQLTSSIAYADAIPIAFFAKEFVKVHELKKATDVLMTSTLMKDRWRKGSIERDIKASTTTEEYATFRQSPSFVNSLMYLVKLGDAGAIIAGGYPVYKYHIKQGKTHEEAIREFEKVTESTQQSSDLSEQSAWQRGGSFAKLFTMFMSSPNQYFRKEVGALRNMVAGRISKKQFLKTMAIYHILLPMLFQWVSDRFTWDEEEQKRAMTLGPLNGYFIAGEMLNYLIREIYGMKTFEPSLPIYQIPKDFGKALELIDPDELDTEEFLRAIRGLAGAVGGVTGLPLKQVVDMTKGISDTLSGDYEIGVAEMMGWSPYKAKKAANK